MHSFLILFPVFLLAVVAALIGATARHRKRKPRNTPLIDSPAIVTSALLPEGAVLVRGELWLARSNNQRSIPKDARCVVVGFSDLHLLIEEQNLNL